MGISMGMGMGMGMGRGTAPVIIQTINSSRIEFFNGLRSPSPFSRGQAIGGDDNR